MKIFILSQYFMITMILTITVGIFTLKPVEQQGAMTTTQVVNVINNDQVGMVHEQYR